MRPWPRGSFEPGLGMNAGKDPAFSRKLGERGWLGMALPVEYGGHDRSAVDRFIVGVSETYDVIVTLPASMAYELRATAEDRTGYTSAWLGDGHPMPAPGLDRLRYFEGMKMMNGMWTLGGRMDA